MEYGKIPSLFIFIFTLMHFHVPDTTTAREFKKLLSDDNENEVVDKVGH